MVRCNRCGKGIEKEWKWYMGKKYCPDCFEEVIKEESSQEPYKNSELSNKPASKEPAVSSNSASGYDTPMIAKIFNIISWIVWICGGISAIALGGVLDNLLYILLGLMVAFLAGCIPMGFSTIIRLLAEIAWNTRPKKRTH